MRRTRLAKFLRARAYSFRQTRGLRRRQPRVEKLEDRRLLAVDGPLDQLDPLAPPKDGLVTWQEAMLTDKGYPAVANAPDVNGEYTIALNVSEFVPRGQSNTSIDFGDAPDLAVGTGPGDYNTLLSDNGPHHSIVPGLKLGANVDGDSGTLQNAAADADDTDGALPDDEDGLINPTADLMLTVGARPRINLRATNTTSVSATLYGWIDYNADGVFDNATERALTSVPDGTDNVTMILSFLAVPVGFTGTSHARFRLSTDASAANPIGTASDGEVEDYRVSIFMLSDGTADGSRTTKIASDMNGGPTFADDDLFGASMASLGDLDGDGVTDLAVGALRGQVGGVDRGAIHLLFLRDDGSVKSSRMIGHNTPGVPSIFFRDRFGRSLTSLGDVDGDGVTDLAVGADLKDVGGTNRGAVIVLFLNPDGTVKASQLIGHGQGGGPNLSNVDRFGISLASPGDFDGNGVNDLVVGADGDDTGGNDRGAIYLLLLESDGTVKSTSKIAHNTNGGPALADADRLGRTLTSLGDLDGDGLVDLAVGAEGDDTGGIDRGAVYVLFMNDDGTAKSSQKIAHHIGGGPSLVDGDTFGRSLTSLGDLDGDGVTDIAVGALHSADSSNARGKLYVQLLNIDGTVKSSQQIGDNTGGGPSLEDGDSFASSAATLGDINGDGVTDLAVGAGRDDTGGTDRGSVYVLFLNNANPAPVFTSPDTVDVPESITSVLTVTVTDAEAVNFSIVGGTDESAFQMTVDGVLAFKQAPDFETPMDANADNVYELIVQASDGSSTKSQELLVTVYDVNEPLGDYNGDGRVDSADYTVYRNSISQVVMPFTGADGDGSGVIDRGDYGVWKDQFGSSRENAATGNAAARANENSFRRAVLDRAQTQSSRHLRLDTIGASTPLTMESRVPLNDLLLARRQLQPQTPRHEYEPLRVANLTTKEVDDLFAAFGSASEEYSQVGRP